MSTATIGSRRVEPEAGADRPLYSFIAALAGGDLTGAAACFTREGCLITADGTSVHGRREIADLLAQLIARRTEIEVEQLVLRRAGEVALADCRWTMHSDGPEQSRFSQSSAATVVVREVERVWKIAVIAPWGSH